MFGAGKLSKICLKSFTLVFGKRRTTYLSIFNRRCSAMFRSLIVSRIVVNVIIHFFDIRQIKNYFTGNALKPNSWNCVKYFLFLCRRGHVWCESANFNPAHGSRMGCNWMRRTCTGCHMCFNMPDLIFHWSNFAFEHMHGMNASSIPRSVNFRCH